MGMVIDCAAYEDGRRVADIDLEQAGSVETGKGRFIWIGLHEPNEELLRKVQQQSASTIALSRMPIRRTSGRNWKSMASLFSSSCAQRSSTMDGSCSAKPISSPGAAMW